MKPTDLSPTKHSNSIKQLLAEYHSSHLNRTNQLIHYLCVPLIFWTVTAFLWLIKIPFGLNLVYPVAVLLGIYYLLKSLKVFVVMTVFTTFCLLINYFMEQQGLPLLSVAIVVFILAWIGQFIGHKIEGKKPSFFKDLQFLLIGPAWVAFKFFNIKLWQLKQEKTKAALFFCHKKWLFLKACCFF